MQTVEEILNSLDNSCPSIVETGCVHTLEIADWVSRHPTANFVNIDLDFALQLATHKDLESNHTARYCTFLTQDHGKYLSTRTWLDAVFLHPSDLQAGVVEFLLALSTGARIIVIDGYQTRGALAIKRAKQIGWEFEASGELNILRRPK